MWPSSYPHPKTSQIILDILSRKLERTVIECTPRGGSEVTVIFSDNTQRIVKLANENQCKDIKPKSPVSL